jgi:L-asparagine transporter-like permease
MISIAGIVGAGLFLASGCIIAMAGSTALITYIMADTPVRQHFSCILSSLCHNLRMHQQLEGSHQTIALKTWFYPWLTWIAFFFMIAIVIMILFHEKTKSAVTGNLSLSTVIVFIYLTVTVSLAKNIANKISIDFGNIKRESFSLRSL